MAEAAGAVDIERGARVDPDLQAVAVFEPTVAAPNRLLLSSDADVEQQAVGAPGHTHVGKVRLPVAGAAVELRQIQKRELFIELDAAGFATTRTWTDPDRRFLLLLAQRR